jgi:ubiquinol oxidase
MRGRLNFSTALAVVLSWEKVLCFTPSNNILLPSDVAFLTGLQHHEKRARRNINVSVQGQLQGPSPSSQLFSSVLPNDEKPSVVIDDEASQKQEIAKEALMKLLARQQKEVQETEELIKNLRFDSQGESTGSNITDSNFEAPSIAASILAGFDYGFVSRSEGCRFENVNDFNDKLFEGYGPPANIFSLGSQQFMRNLNAMKGEYKDEDDFVLTPKQKNVREKLKQLTLNSTAIWEREESRGPIVAPLIIKVPYLSLCYLLDVVFEGRYVPSRFFLLETVARMPYFSYISMLHLYETLGFWRRSKDVKRVHFAEEWNEFHHLMIMESLGGDQPYWVRFIAQHSAIAYYIGLTILWAVSPSLSYKFSELLETHAVDTYSQFVDENEKLLKELPPSLAAIEYYVVGVSDPMFGEYQTSALASGTDIRKSGTNMKSLYDVFHAIRLDEGDHVGTMKACLDPEVAVISPSLETRFLTGVALSAAVGYFLTTGDFTEISPEIAEGLDDSIPAVDSLFGGVASMLQGLKVVEEEGAEALIEEESLFAVFSPELVAASVRQFFIAVLKALGLLGL